MAAAAFPHWSGRHTLRRRRIQLGFLAVFVALPLFDLFRFDFGRSRLYLFRQEIWLDEWTILWLALMFAMWVVGAASLVLGRVYCAYACPQTIFVEIAHDIEALARGLGRRLPGRRVLVERGITLVLVTLGSLAASVLFMGYFAPLPDVLDRLLHLDISPWIGAVGAFCTLLGVVFFGFVQESFCRSVCPYGLLQGVIEDGRSLHVQLDESGGACIDCGACARMCPMAIDIRQGAFQIECTRCGACVDSCDTVLARLKPSRPGVLRFDIAGSSWRRWDLKRALVAVSTVGFGVALAVAMAQRERISLHLSPLYETARASGADEASAASQFLLRAANRTPHPVVLKVRLEGLPANATIDGLGDATVAPGAERRFELVVTLPRNDVKGSVTPFGWVFGTPEGERRFASTFFMRRRERS